MKDVCYAALFDKRDLPSLYRYAAKVRTTHNQELVNDFNNKCEKKWNDHNPILDGIEFLQVSKSEDLVVNVGINLFIDQILGLSVVTWDAIQIGTGVTTPGGNQTALTAVNGNGVLMSAGGWKENAGTSLRFGSIFGESRATVTVNEAGVFTSISGGTMLNRVMFANAPISHTINITGFVVSCIIEFVPVM
jgi:hypothetical protein